MKFRKKPVVIEAFIYGLHIEPKWFLKAIKSGKVEEVWLPGNDKEKYPPDGLKIKTLEGEMHAHYGGEYIIKGIKGEIYPCDAEIFELTYERVE